ncbi:MAG: hypothetical protein MR890_05530 [Akkermansia muciniphila]|nr:hypothetical protein [Akkermansia muciniphila]
MKLDCRDKLMLEDGSTCAFMNHSAGWDSIRLCMFDLYAPSGTLIVKCRVMGRLFRYLSFTNAEGQELATIRFKWSLPVLHLPDGSEIELNFFRHLGTDFLPEASVELFGSTINSTDGVFSFSEDIEADKQGLIKAILCFCKQYPKTREKEMERGRYLSLAFDTLLAVLLALAAFACARIC